MIERLFEPFASDVRSVLAAFDREVEALGEDQQIDDLGEPLDELSALVERLTVAARSLHGSVFGEPYVEAEEVPYEEVEAAA